MVNCSQEAWVERIVEDYSDMIMRIALHHFNCPGEAEDITQKVFLKLIQKQPSFQGQEHEKAWLIRVTINLCKDHFKSSWFRKVVPLKEGVIASSPQSDYPPPPQSPPQQQELLSLIHTLPQNYRNVIYLYYYEDLSVSEISEILQTKEGTVMSWLHRAREQLKTKLEGGFCLEER